MDTASEGLLAGADGFPFRAGWKAPLPREKAVFGPWPRGDWVLDADVAARDAQRPGLTPGDLKVLEKSRERALLRYRKPVFWRWPRGDWTQDADIPGRS